MTIEISRKVKEPNETKPIKMEKDSTAKIFLKDNARFAETVNLAFGEGYTSADSLREISEQLILPYARGKARDILKLATIKEDDNTIYVLIGLEPQTYIDYTMPARLVQYDWINLEQQIVEIYNRHKCEGTLDNPLSRLNKGDTIKAVRSIVVYLGVEPWDGPRSLKDMYEGEFTGREAGMIQYQMAMVYPKEISEEKLMELKTECRNVYRMMKYVGDWESFSRVVAEERNQLITDDAKNFAQALTGINMYEKEEADMKTVLDKFGEEREKAGITKGMIEGITKGRHEGKVEGRLEGIELEKRRIALEMLKGGMCEDDVVMYTKVSLEKLRSWEKSTLQA